MFTLPQLPYAYNALEPYIDEATMKLHHDKHHATYVTNLNDALKDQDKFLSMDIDELMENITRVPEEMRTKVKNNGGGHANHSLFWQVMAPPNGSEPTSELLSAINSTFGSVMSLEEKMNTRGAGRFGSGWVWLVVADGKLEIVDTANQDSPLMEYKTPILGIDVWEHAYYLKYQNKRADYLKAWWNVVNWQEVEKRFTAGMK